LSAEEKKIVLKVAKASGGYLIGVDHIISDGEIYVLEANGSPGSRSKFGDKRGKEISRSKLIAAIVTAARDKSTWKGFDTEEHPDEATVRIEDIGKTEARLDTGNESHSALHAVNIKILSGRRVKFDTINDKTLVRKIVGRAKINVGSGKSERRTTVALDLSLAGVKYKGVKFNLADRSDNEFPVLIGQRFLSRADISVNVNEI
jgi:hypothetical protein